MSMCLRVLSSRSDLMKDVFGELSRTALVNMLSANDSKDGMDGRSEVRIRITFLRTKLDVTQTIHPYITYTFPVTVYLITLIEQPIW